MVVRQANKDITKIELTTQPYWFSFDKDAIQQLRKKHEAEFRTLIENFQLEGYWTIVIFIHVSLKTGKYAMSEIMLRKKAVTLADQLPLDYLFSLFDSLELNSVILNHVPCKDDNKYTTYQMFLR